MVIQGDRMSAALSVASLTKLDLQVAAGVWFGESARIARLGFGYLPLDRPSPALEQLTSALDLAERGTDAGQLTR